MDGEGAHAVKGRGFAIDGAGGCPGGAPGELVLADLIRGQRGGPCGAEEHENDEDDVREDDEISEHSHSDRRQPCRDTLAFDHGVMIRRGLM